MDAHIFHGVGAWASEDRDKANPDKTSQKEATAGAQGNYGSGSMGRVKPKNPHYKDGQDAGSPANARGNAAELGCPSGYVTHKAAI
jgi:hypothetical protein